jgi:nucleoside-diphosphate-sugar epimerase
LKILVTRSEGVVGSCLITELIANKHDVYCINRVEVNRKKYYRYDLSKEISIAISKVLSKIKLDVLIYLAAAKGDYNLKYDDFYRDNVNAIKNIISLFKVLDIKPVISYSTVSVYGHNNKIKSEEVEFAPNNSYGVTKMESENLFIKWFDLDQIKNQLTILRLSFIYGESNYSNN